MKRLGFASAAGLLCSILSTSDVLAQAKAPPAQAPATKAASTPVAPAAPAKWVRPVKGTATIEIIQAAPKKVGAEMWTVLKIKNTSSGSIALLKIDEYWYNKKLAIVSGDQQRITKPFNPGEIAEVTMKSPMRPDLYTNQYQFSHAQGKIDVKAVKKFQ